MPRSRTPNPIDVAPGAVFGFRTTTLYTESPAPTDRFGAFKVIGRSKDLLVLAALDGVWPAMPTPEQVAHQELLRTGPDADVDFVLGTDPKWRPGLLELTLIDTVPLTDVEEQHAALYAPEQALSDSYAPRSYGDPDYLNLPIELNWRMEHDAEALQEDYFANEERRRMRYAAAKERYRTRLQGVTLSQLLAEDPFQRWTPSPPFPPAAFRRAAREQVYAAYRQLQELGEKPRKPAVRAVMKALVGWFNDADVQYDGIIETEEREDISAVLEEIAHATRQPSLADEFEAWHLVDEP